MTVFQTPKPFIDGGLSKQLDNPTALATASSKRYSQIFDLLKNIGQGSKRQVTEAGQKYRGGVAANLMSRGMGSTTLFDSMKQSSLERDRKAISDIDAGVGGQLAGVMQGEQQGLLMMLLQRALQPKDKSGKAGMFGSIGGGILGAFLGGPAGATAGAGIGGQLGNV